jgi:lysozyme
MKYLEILKTQLVIDEGKRNKMYLDTKQIPTIGVGHNLRDVPISDRAVQVILEDDIALAEAETRKLIPVFNRLSEERKAVVVNMMFNMGYPVFSKFKRTLALINAHRYSEAADEMLQSDWAKQVGQRAIRLANAMRGTEP